MNIKKIVTLVASSLLVFLNTSNVNAADNFIDNNSITQLVNKNSDVKIVISEYNTGKIISSRYENNVVEFKNLPAKLTTFILSEQLRDKKITLNSKIKLVGSDDILEKYKIENEISVKDAIFLLEQENSDVLIKSILEHFNITISGLQNILDKLTMRDSVIETLEITNQNKSTAKNISYLTEVTVKNFPEILDITKNPEYTFENGEKADNDIKFLESDSIRSLGISYEDNNLVTVTYSGNTRIIITALNVSEERDDLFENMQNIYSYIFSNYEYRLALVAGTYDINNENITTKSDIYDLFYKAHSDKDIKYYLMNGKIMLFQNYYYLSGNSGTVFADYVSNENSTTLSKIKDTFVQDNDFDDKSNKEKVSIVSNRIQYFAMFVVLIYSGIFIILYLLRKPFDKGDK